MVEILFDCLSLNTRSHSVFFFSFRVKPAIFDLLLAVCIAAYLGMMYLAIQVSHYIYAVVCSSSKTCTALYNLSFLYVVLV